MKSILIAFCTVLYLSYAAADCQVDLNTYSTSDGLVIADIAHIATFSVKCPNKPDGKLKPNLHFITTIIYYFVELQEWHYTQVLMERLFQWSDLSMGNYTK